MRLTHVRLLADDLEPCAAFYRDVLGLEMTLAAGEGIYYEFAAGGVLLGLYKRSLMSALVEEDLGSSGSPTESAVLTFAVEDVDATCEELRARGAEITSGPRDFPEAFLRVAHSRDPAGHLIEINSPLPS